MHYIISTLLQSGVQIYIRIEDNDSTFLDDDLNNNVDDLLDEVFIQVPSGASSSSINNQTLGIHGAASVNTSYQLVCARDNQYGSDCSVFCVPQNDSNGHYNCDITTGAKECLVGFTDPSTNCVCPIGTSNCLSSLSTGTLTLPSLPQ